MMAEKQLINRLRRKNEQLQKINKRLRREITELGISIMLYEDDLHEKDQRIMELEKKIKKVRGKRII